MKDEESQAAASPFQLVTISVFQLVCVWGGERKSRFVCFSQNKSKLWIDMLYCRYCFSFIHSFIWSKQCVIHLLQHRQSITSLCKSLTTVQGFCIFVKQQFYTGKGSLYFPCITLYYGFIGTNTSQPSTILNANIRVVGFSGSVNMYSTGLAGTGWFWISCCYTG